MGDWWVGQLNVSRSVCRSEPSEIETESAGFFTNPPKSVRLQEFEIRNDTKQQWKWNCTVSQKNVPSLMIHIFKGLGYNLFNFATEHQNTSENYDHV